MNQSLEKVCSNGDETIPVVFATDENFIPYLYVALQSLVDNSSVNNRYDITILYTDIEEYKQNQFKQLEKDNIAIRFYDMTQLMAEYKDIWYTHWNYTDSVYYRFFIPQLFDKYSKVIYVDCDVIVNSDIADLYYENLDGKYIGAVIGLARQHPDDPFRDYIENILKIKKENYFNAGVLVFDIDKLKTIRFFDLCMDTLKGIGKPLFQDQDVLNVTFNGNIKYLNCTYNFTWNVINVYKNSAEMLAQNCREDFISALSNPKIIHYAGKYKPWKQPHLAYADYFWQYARKTPFYEEIIYKNCNKVDRSTIYNFVKHKSIYFRYLKYKFLQLCSFGKKKEHYNEKVKKLQLRVNDYRKTVKSGMLLKS